VLTDCGRRMALARRSKTAKTSRLSLAKRPWLRPFLTGTAPQTEFVLTHSKQTTDKFLTGARTHLSFLSFCHFLHKISPS
jgi:hypothetical protein